MSSFDEIVATMTQRVSTINAFGKKLRFQLDEQIMHIDGTTNPPTVGTSDGPADATITVSVENFSRLLDKTLNPMVAFTTGKVRLKGDMGAASALQKIF
jgi:putative sterol carrier protein